MDKQEYLTLQPLFEELSGPRVSLRPYREADAQQLREAIVESRDHLRPWVSFADGHQTLEESRDWVLKSQAKWITREECPLAIWERQTGRFLGGAGLHPRDWQIRYFEIGYWLRASAAGQGYMSEAVGLLVDYLFTGLAAHRVEIRCDEQNLRSAAIPRRLGFVEEGCLHQNRLAFDNSLRNTLIFALTTREALLT